MDNDNKVHQGEILMLLVKRDPRDGLEIAKEMGINQSHLSRLYKQPSLTIKVRKAASYVLGVNIGIFENGLGYELPDIQNRVEEPGEHDRLKEEVARLEQLVAEQAAALLKERAVSERLEGLLREFMERVGAGR